jgi:hypothetical protein
LNDKFSYIQAFMDGKKGLLKVNDNSKNL